MTETTSTIQYFTSADSSFSSGWYFVENGVRQSAADTANSLSDANKVLLGASTPTGNSNPVTGGGGDDVFVVQSDTPNTVVIEDLSGDNTVLFSTGITVTSVSTVDVGVGVKVAIIRFVDGNGNLKTLQVKALNHISFEFETGAVAGRVFSIEEFEAYIGGAPAFSEKTYAVDLAEDASSGDDVITTVAGDVTTGDSLTYSIEGGNDANLFAINEATGSITLNGAVDFESGTTEYVLSVQVEDSNGGIDTATVTVRVTDVNDNTPTLVATLNGSVAENDAGADVGVTIRVTDADAGTVFTPDSFSIQSGASTNAEVADKFEVVANGDDWALKLKDGETFDHEETETVELILTVSDGDNQSPE